MKIIPLNAGPWPCRDPFLFCVHHLDDYPKGNGRMGPDARLTGRLIGQDFAGVDGWNMYHAEQVPGFPQHPHRGFETVTIARSGVVDHADSLGAAARFGHGDTQWITAGKGISHSEMFPLLNDDQKNPLDLFQIWLNLPKKNKLAPPYFSVFWHEQTPKRVIEDAAGKKVEILLIAGRLDQTSALAPPPQSWAAEAEADVAIWVLKFAPQARFSIPPTAATTQRTLYFFRGANVEIAGTAINQWSAVEVKADQETEVINGNNETEILLLQGKPINEPIAQHGPFVMNTRQELQEAFSDYQQTRFGGWPWGDEAPVHAKTEPRFARYPDGHLETPGK